MLSHHFTLPEFRPEASMTQHSDPARTLPPQAVQVMQAALHAISVNATVGVQITGVGVGTATGICGDTASPITSAFSTPEPSSCWQRRSVGPLLPGPCR